MSRSKVEQQIRDRIAKHGRITFAEFMRVCLYSRDGGFYASRAQGISTHFGTSAMSHPVFGALIAQQLEQMWHLLDDPPVFHVIEVGSGDGALARSIVQACWRNAPRLAQALCFVAADYAPRWLHDSRHAADWENDSGDRVSATEANGVASIRRVQADGLRAFRHVVGCILSNELIDNFPVHRFAIQDGSLKEVFVTLADGTLTEVLAAPSSPGIEQRLADLGLSLAEAYRGEVNLALADWTDQIARTLDRGFVLTIDYGQEAAELYAPANRDGTLVCYRRHAASKDPFDNVGQQDITCHVDFTSLMQLGEQHGLTTLGYATQSEFLTKLGFPAFLDALGGQDMSSARATLNRMAMMALVDPEQYGDLKVLAQAKGQGLGAGLLGFTRART
jgi:SAM-dependent MidA family methyltransferase